ncbi:hypothetical protein BDV35DRAFT_351918 [Aspergillus flavus]|uniref:Uncharacterized protein n=1 Tax=Aspergillus flavus TaxID=5059 RepID=A0A5N6GXV8_ASPFL|nr:hypothetical protein BDV35DRAFT_351918 [Aspergillus flavus]
MKWREKKAPEVQNKRPRGVWPSRKTRPGILFLEFFLSKQKFLTVCTPYINSPPVMEFPK